METSPGLALACVHLCTSAASHDRGFAEQQHPLVLEHWEVLAACWVDPLVPTWEWESCVAVSLCSSQRHADNQITHWKQWHAAGFWWFQTCIIAWSLLCCAIAVRSLWNGRAVLSGMQIAWSVLTATASSVPLVPPENMPSPAAAQPVQHARIAISAPRDKLVHAQKRRVLGMLRMCVCYSSSIAVYVGYWRCCARHVHIDW